MPLHALEPQVLWSHFVSICGIPRKSGQEQAIGDWLVLRGRAWNLETLRDETGNVLIRKPAAPGCERWPGVILQAHMDMVCQARTGSGHDFAVDPIRPFIPEDHPEWVHARETTLGADNGIGMAAILAVLESATIKHGPLEALFTVNEEDGMSGARGLSATALRGEILLNLDSENMSELTIGCAGARRCMISQSFGAGAADGALSWYRLSVSGLRGGHSGIDIASGRLNASHALIRLLQALPRGLCLAKLDGGTAMNAIPREAMAVFAVPVSDEAALRANLEPVARQLHDGCRETEPGFHWELQAHNNASALLSAADSGLVLDLVHGLPDGLIAMEPAMANTIRTSLNMGILRLDSAVGSGLKLDVSVMVRSSSEEEKQGLVDTLDARCRAAGAALTLGPNSPAWQPEPEAPLVRQATQVYRRVFNKDPHIISTHGGLECGLFRPLYPRWQMISFGPDIKSPHSPDECLYIPSVGWMWEYLLALLADLR